MEQPVRYACLSELRAAFRDLGFRPRRALGQNFLIDGNLVRVVADAGDLGSQDVVLEVGAGPGNLTRVLAKRAASVVAVEIDPVLCGLAAGQLARLDNVRLVPCAILDPRGQVSAEVSRAIEEAMKAAGAEHFKVVANLPYGVGSALISRLLLDDARVALMAVTVQEEVAERLVARPATREYGVLSVLVQSTARVEILRRMAPSVFWPSPKVGSALVRIAPDSALRGQAGDVGHLMRVTRALFAQRRKTAANSLAAGGAGVSRQGAVRVLSECGVEPSRRGETLSVEEVRRVAQATRRQRGTSQ